MWKKFIEDFVYVYFFAFPIGLPAGGMPYGFCPFFCFLLKPFFDAALSYCLYKFKSKKNKLLLFYNFIFFFGYLLLSLNNLYMVIIVKGAEEGYNILIFMAVFAFIMALDAALLTIYLKGWPRKIAFSFAFLCAMLLAVYLSIYQRYREPTGLLWDAMCGVAIIFYLLSFVLSFVFTMSLLCLLIAKALKKNH
jgi:hypothetical protein